jgi:putative component of membrane protein insertase Oxa1/YidC/SpoIIIJ protein YidD
MIKAIEKYGLIGGITRGLKRIYRCREPNGGIDIP